MLGNGFQCDNRLFPAVALSFARLHFLASPVFDNFLHSFGIQGPRFAIDTFALYVPAHFIATLPATPNQTIGKILHMSNAKKSTRISFFSLDKHPRPSINILAEMCHN